MIGLDAALCIQEKPKEKTVFNVKLEAFDAAAKPKIIREVKAMVPNLTLIEVRFVITFGTVRAVLPPLTLCRVSPGEEVRGVAAPGTQGRHLEGGRRETQKDICGPRRNCCA